jgi:hypothetical protein
VLQAGAQEPVPFGRRAAEFELSKAKLQSATGTARGAATLDWLRALKNTLKAVPFERVAGPHEPWLKTHGELIVYSEPSGEWLISYRMLLDVHTQLATSPAADEIAWLMVMNGIPGECEGYVPCYAMGLNTLEGEYLRRHPRGAHRTDAFVRINEALRNVVDDLLKRRERDEYLSVPRDCDDLLFGARPLRAAVAAANGVKTETMTLIDRLIAYCPNQ